MRRLLLLCLAACIACHASEPATAAAPVSGSATTAAPATVFETVSIENDLVRITYTAKRGAITQFELKTVHPVDLPKHLQNPLSPQVRDAQGQRTPVPVLTGNGTWDLHARLTNSRGRDSDNRPDASINGLTTDDTAPWTVTAKSATSVTFTYAKSSPDLTYALTWTLVEGRPSVNATLVITNRSGTDVRIEPTLVPLVGIHQDYGPVESYYLCAYTLKNSADAWPETANLPAVGETHPLAIDANVKAIGLKSRFFAAWWSPDHIERIATTAPVAVAAPVANQPPADTDGPAVTPSGRPAQAEGPATVPGSAPGAWTSAAISGYMAHATLEHQAYLVVRATPVVLKPGTAFTVPWAMTVSSMTSPDLKRLTPTEATVEYTDGFYRFFRTLTLVFTWSLEKLAYVVVNYGVAVILLTLLLKLAMFRLTYKQHESMMKMQKLAPELKYIQEQYKSDKQKLAAKQMELFKKHQVNPLGGCLPVLIQIPIFIALYQAFSHCADLRGQGFLWIPDLTLPDQLVYLGFNFPAWMPFWSNLPASINPLPLLYIAATIWMSLSQKPPEGNPEDFQVQMGKTMRWMPVLFGVIFYNMPAGLVLYFTANAVLSTIEIKYVKKKLGMP